MGKEWIGRFATYTSHTDTHTHTPSRVRALTKQAHKNAHSAEIKCFCTTPAAGPCFFALCIRFTSGPLVFFFLSQVAYAPQTPLTLFFLSMACTYSSGTPTSEFPREGNDERVDEDDSCRRRTLRCFSHFKNQLCVLRTSVGVVAVGQTLRE